MCWVLCMCICGLPPWGVGRPAAESLLGLKFCHLASISLVCRLRTSWPTTPPHPLMARVSKLKAPFGRKKPEIWNCGAVVSQAVVASSSLLLMLLFFTNPDLHKFFFFLSLLACCSLSFAPYTSCVISWPYQAICPASFIKVQSVFIHLSSRN